MFTASTPATRATVRGGKYLFVAVGEEEYGISVARVREIVGLRAIVRGTLAAVFVRGTVNVRGTAVSVVDLRERLGMSPASTGGDARQAARAEALRCIVVVDVAAGGAGRGAPTRVPMGIVVDELREVAAVDAECVEDPPRFGAVARTEFLLGVAAGGSCVRALLDVDRVLGSADADGAARAAA